MWDDKLLELIDPYIGKKVTTEKYTLPSTYRGYVDEVLYEPGRGTLEVCLVRKKGLSGEERDWTYEHVLIVEMDGFKIIGFTVDDRVLGGDALGNYDPSQVFTEKAYFDEAVKFLKRITK